MMRSPCATPLGRILTRLISETNGITLADTLELASKSGLSANVPEARTQIEAFRELLASHDRGHSAIEDLLEHPVAAGLGHILRAFPRPFQEEHTHLTGSLTAEFVYPRIRALLEGPDGQSYAKKIRDVYGDEALPITSEADVDRLLRLPKGARFSRYLEVLTLAKLVLVDRRAHVDAAYHMAHTAFHRYNVGRIRLKFSLSRATTDQLESLPGDRVSSEDVVLGLYEGFEKFRSEQRAFDYVLSPSFRKESNFFDATRFASKTEDFMHQVSDLLEIMKRHPQLRDKVTDVDTVGDERNYFRKIHFEEMRLGFRKLQFRGFQVRSHHGETWRTLRRGVQAVDNAMNIWHIDALEHGLSLGVNPNYYFHMVFERILERNQAGLAVDTQSQEGMELGEMDWGTHAEIPAKLLAGVRLSDVDRERFIKVKFHTAREIEHYQHDVLNRMINKGVELVALPSSNIALTSNFPSYKDHPFSWWEKKGVSLAVGTDNHVTLNTDFIREMLILLVTDHEQLKITKLLMTVTGETRRPVLSQLLWSMRDD